MKFIKRDNAYYNSTKSNKVKTDSFEAWSYGWWKYATTWNGLRIFNNYGYSNTTSKHQSDARSMFNYNWDITLYHTNKSLDDTVDALEDEINCLRSENKNLIERINAPRTQKKTNLKRVDEINCNVESIKKLKEVLKSGGVEVENNLYDNNYYMTELDYILNGVENKFLNMEIAS